MEELCWWKSGVVEALELCERGYETGRVALEGTHTALLADPRVRRAYLRA